MSATATAVSLQDLVRSIYEGTDDKGDRRAMAEVALAEQDEEARDALALTALMSMFGALNADERPRPARPIRRGRSKSTRKTLGIDLLKVRWDAGYGVVKPIGEFTDADLVRSEMFFGAQLETASLRKEQCAKLRAALRKHNVVSVRGLPPEVYSDILS